MPMTIKLGRIVTNLERLPPIMFINALITWSYKIM